MDKNFNNLNSFHNGYWINKYINIILRMATLDEEQLNQMNEIFYKKITAKTKIQPDKLIMRSIISSIKEIEKDLWKFYRKSQIAKQTLSPKNHQEKYVVKIMFHIKFQISKSNQQRRQLQNLHRVKSTYSMHRISLKNNQTGARRPTSTTCGTRQHHQNTAKR